MDQELKQYLAEQFKTLATKDDLKATNDRLNSTNDSLKAMADSLKATNDSLKATNETVENLQSFVRKNMVTKQELQDLRGELPTKDDFSMLQTSVDGIAKINKDNTDEVKVLGHQISRMEGWIKQAAPKLGVEYKP